MDQALVQECLERDDLAIQSGDIILIRAWPKEWLAEGFHECAGLALDAAQWLVEQGAKAIGIDLGNIVDNADMTRQVHMYLLQHEIPICENLANLDRLEAKRFTFLGLPLHLEGCTGSPVRAAALLD